MPQPRRTFDVPQTPTSDNRTDPEREWPPSHPFDVTLAAAAPFAAKARGKIAMIAQPADKQREPWVGSRKINANRARDSVPVLLGPTRRRSNLAVAPNLVEAAVDLSSRP